MTPLERKENKLVQDLSRFRTVLVAFSGGVDSSYLAYMAHRVLGSGAQMVTAVSPSVSKLQEELARDFARRYGFRHEIIHTREMEDANYTANPSNRCYFCKSELYAFLARLKAERDIEVIVDGSNRDDAGDYRPGRQAADDKGVVSPLLEADLNKEEIRALSRKWCLPSADLPAMPCLSSRFPYGVEITPEKLRRVEEAEAFLRHLGLKNFRVRHHETLARLEVDRDEVARILDPRTFDDIDAHLRSLGYLHVTLDLRGFRSGSLNQLLQLEVK